MILNNKKSAVELVGFFNNGFVYNAVIVNSKKSAVEFVSFLNNGFVNNADESVDTTANGEYGHSRWPDKCQQQYQLSISSSCHFSDNTVIYFPFSLSLLPSLFFFFFSVDFHFVIK